jgi:DNA-binding transcriptional ArsR family regulator
MFPAHVLCASCSRGIFRRFKRFLGVCLEEYLVSGDRAKPIDLKLAKVALTEDEIFREMDLELSQIFKKEDARRLAAKILDLLMKIKEASQGSVAKTLQVSESAVSRILDKLEDYALVRREWHGQEKIVRANF